MDKDKTIRKGIIASVIASVIFMIVLEPLMKILWSFFNNTSNKIYNSTAVRKFLKMLFLKIHIFVFQLIMKIIQLEHRIYLG